MMTLEGARFRSPNGRKLTTGLAILISRKSRATRPTTNRTASVWAFQNGSLYQSHSCPLLSRTAQRRADDRGGQPRHAEDRHGRALLLGREAVDQDPLAGGLEPAAGDPLDHPEKDQLLEAGGQAAQHRGGGEDGDGEEEVPATAQVGREPARDRQDGGVSRQVAGHDP